MNVLKKSRYLLDIVQKFVSTVKDFSLFSLIVTMYRHHGNLNDACVINKSLVNN